MKEEIMDFIGFICCIALAIIVFIICFTIVALFIGVSIDILKVMFGG